MVKVVLRNGRAIRYRDADRARFEDNGIVVLRGDWPLAIFPRERVERVELDRPPPQPKG